MNVKRQTYINALFLSIVAIALFQRCNNYENQEITENKVSDPNMSSTEQYQKRIFVRKKIPRDLLNDTKFEIEFIEKRKSVECRLESGFFSLKETNDGSLFLAIYLYGNIEKTTNSMKECWGEFIMPWDLRNPPTIPHTWLYRDEYFTQHNSLAIRDSQASTRVNITEKAHDKRETQQPLQIFPLPPNSDPAFSSVSGKCELQTGSLVKIEELRILEECNVTMQDHSGTTIKVTLKIQK